MQESTQALRALGGNVVERIYPGMGHTVNDDEIRYVRAALVPLLRAAEAAAPAVDA